MYFVKNNFQSIFLGLMFILSTGTVSGRFIDSHNNMIRDQRDAAGVQEKYEYGSDVAVDLDIDKLRVCRGIQLEILRDRNATSVKVSWVPPNVREPIILVRSFQPISSNEQFLKSETVAVLNPGTSFFIDQNLSSGNYYYALALRSQFRAGEIKLYANENYTMFPLNIVSNKKRTTAEYLNAPSQITSIRAQMLNETDVWLHWDKVSNEDVIYVVYRGNQPLDNPSLLNSRNIIALLPSQTNFFTDKNLPEFGAYYYAVGTRSKTGAEDKNLIANNSYTQEPILYGAAYTPTAFDLHGKVDGTEVKLSWSKPKVQGKNFTRYKLFRSSSPIKISSDLNNAVELDLLEIDSTNYTDTITEEGEYYYALISIDKRGNQNGKITQGENSLINPIRIRGGEESNHKTETTELTTDKKIKEEPKQEHKKSFPFSSFRAQERNKRIYLFWQSNFQEEDINTNESVPLAYVYRFYKKPKTFQDIVLGNLVGKIPHQQGFVSDKPLQNGLYYYAIFLQTKQGMQPTAFIEGENFIGPINFNGIETPVPFSGSVQTENLSSESTQKKDSKDEKNFEQEVEKEVQRRLQTESEKEKKRNKEQEKESEKVEAEVQKRLKAIEEKKAQEAKEAQEKAQREKEKQDKLKEEIAKEVQRQLELQKTKSQPKVQQTENTPAVPQTKTQKENYPTSNEKNTNVKNVTTIVQATYLKGHYESAIQKLKPFLENQNLSVQAMAKFYSGLSLYRLSRFDEAGVFFSDPLVQKAYKEKANFWYKRTMEYAR